MTKIAQNAHLTFKANVGIGRHDWLRLTPAYSVGLVEQELELHEQKAVVFDPFSGTGTTGLCAAEKGHNAVLSDVNPFLVWLAKSKTSNYSHQDITKARRNLKMVLEIAKGLESKNLWVPPIYNIERWWNPPQLLALSRIKNAIDSIESSHSKNLLLIAFCNSIIKESNASFGHQSVSFKQAIENEKSFANQEEDIFKRYFENSEKILVSAEIPLNGVVNVIETDSRLFHTPTKVDVVISSPPYVNRMSYIRELRPYMYWLGFLKEAREAGELDWKAIGGTWGTATSKLNSWHDERNIPISGLALLVKKISKGDARNGPLLANYVTKYFYDMWEHFASLYHNVNTGGKIVYIIGNSSFYNNIVPAEKWYGELMTAVGFTKINIEVIRKRNSNKALFEFAVTARKE